MGRGGYHSSRAEFLSDEAILKYSRNGGCFVTTKKAIVFVIFAILSLLVVITLMYFYGPYRSDQLVIQESNDIEKLINDTLSEKSLEEELLLPNTLYPVHYRLWLHPILDKYTDNFTFTGRVKILINCLEMTKKIVLHCDDLNITHSQIKLHSVKQMIEYSDSNNTDFLNFSSDNAVMVNTSNYSETSFSVFSYDLLNITSQTWPLRTSNSNTTQSTTEVSKNNIIKLSENEPLHIIEINRDEDNSKLTIISGISLQSGELYTLDISFEGHILNNFVGLYRTHYMDFFGNIRWLTTTNFQSIYARRVFPCFDEPKFKATFEISVARMTNMTALSNMPLMITEPMKDNSDWVWDHFQQSPPMSTYTVAFTVSDFESIMSNVSSTETRIQIWAPKEDLFQAQYALEVVNEVLPFLEDYFGIKYPLPKLDLLVIPNFNKDAMENWGLISFRQSSLLFDLNSRSTKSRSSILANIVRELTHQWFGNLVTMEWWSDQWLNEGFGAFMAEVVITSLRPRWHAYSSLKIRDTYNSLYFDTLKSTHSIQSYSKNAQIEQIFDKIIYQKGCSVIKMLNYTLSQDIFKWGIHQYLKKYSFQSATQNDLWLLFTQKAQNESIFPNGLTVKALMNSWSTQSGYPCISVTRNYSHLYAVINQTKMTEDVKITSNALWYVPVTYITRNDTGIKMFWLENTRETLLNLSDSGNDSWILLNIEETGFYRVNYDNRNWRLLVQQLRINPDKIPVANRGQLIDDAFQLANAEIINYTIAFDLVKYLYITEPNYIPWYSALRNMEELRVIISNYEYSGLYDNFLLKLVKPIYNKLGTEERSGDTQNEKLLRLHIVTSSCMLRYAQCLSWSRQQYHQWMQELYPDNNNPIPIEYRFIVQCSAIKSGGPNEWNFLWNRTSSTLISSVDLETAYLSLGCTYDPWLINRYLEYSLIGNISLEYIPYVWKSINHPVGVRIGFQFLRLNWKRIYEKYEEVDSVLSTIFHDFISQLSTEVDLEDLTTFYKLHQNDLKSVSTILQNTVDRMKIRIMWKTKHLDSVINWLQNNRY